MSIETRTLHGPSCPCRHCSASGYPTLLSRVDYQQQQIAQLTAALSAARHSIAVERFRYLTVVMERAIERQDRAAWESACAERMTLGIGDAEMVELTSKEAA